MASGDRADVRTRLARWIKDLETRRDALDQAAAALRLVLEQADIIEPELADSMAAAVYGKNVQRQRTLFDETPALVGEREEATADSSGVYAGTHRDRVIDFFVRNGNRPASNLEIREAVGLNRGAVAVVLYGKDSVFVKLDKDARGKVLWQLRRSEYEAKREIEGEPSGAIKPGGPDDPFSGSPPE